MRIQEDDYLSVADDNTLRTLIGCLEKLPWIRGSAHLPLAKMRSDVAAVVSLCVRAYTTARMLREGRESE